MGERIDVLAVSAYSDDLEWLARVPGGYGTIPGTLIGALHAAGVDIAAERERRELDLTSALGCWLSRDLASPILSRVLCIEDLPARSDVVSAIRDMFIALSVAEQKGVRFRTLVLPVLGAGAARADVGDILPPLLVGAREMLTRSEHLERVVFVERDLERARRLDETMNDLLARVRVSLPRGVVFDAVRRDLDACIQSLLPGVAPEQHQTLADFGRIVGSAESRSFEIGIAGRRLVELIVCDLLGRRKGFELRKNIDALASEGVADWVRSYMHTLRVLGNESAHERGGERNPEAVREPDLLVALFCAHRVLEFWIEQRRRRGVEAGDSRRPARELTPRDET